MENILKQDVRLLTNDVDYMQRVKLSSILDAFQEIAAEHAYELDCGFEQMSEKNMFWVLTRVKFEIIKTPKYKDCITVETWPVQPKSVYFERDYLIKKQGEILVKGTSVWCVLDFAKQSIIPAKSLSLMDIEYKNDRAANFTAGKLAKKGEFLKKYTRTVRALDLDINNHVNNTRYADFIFEGLDAEHMKKDIVSLQINYIKQIRGDSDVDIEYYQGIDGAIYTRILFEGQVMSESELVFA